MKIKLRIFAVVAAFALLLTPMSACGDQTGGEETSEFTSEVESGLLGGIVKAPGPDTWLTEEMVTLSMYMPMQDMFKQYISSMEELSAFKKAEEYTNIKVEIPLVTNATEGLNLIIASGEYPDIWSSLAMYTGGLSKALEDEIIIDLTSFMNENAPNYMSILNSDENIYRNAVDDEGKICSMYELYDSYTSVAGHIVRKDLLDGIGMDLPVTYEDYTEMGRKFLVEYGISDPILITSDSSFFGGGYGTNGFGLSGSGGVSHIYREDNVIKSAFLEDGYRKYVEQLRDWISEGIVNRDFISYGATNNEPMNQAIILGGNAGVYYGHALNITAYPEQASMEGFELAPIVAPVEKEGDVVHFSSMRSLVQMNKNMQVSSQCSNVELALKWLDFWFSDEGYYLHGYGVYGESYTFDEDGNPKYTDLILNNPDGLTPQVARNINTGQTAAFNSQNAVFQIYSEKNMEAVELWRVGTDDAGLMPSALSLTTDEGLEVSSISGDLETYAAETVLRFIMGEKPMSEWEEFVDQCKTMKVERVIEIYQTAMERYVNR